MMIRLTTDFSTVIIEARKQWNIFKMMKQNNSIPKKAIFQLRGGQRTYLDELKLSTVTIKISSLKELVKDTLRKITILEGMSEIQEDSWAKKC